MTTTVTKVVAYVVRDDQLLVFRHRDSPEAGLQVPAGTVEGGEDPRSGVKREAWEETGLEGLRLVRLLGRYSRDMRPHKDEIHDRYVYELEPGGPTKSEWLH